jgi:hypothetical protein
VGRNDGEVQLVASVGGALLRRGDQHAVAQHLDAHVPYASCEIRRAAD